MKLKQHFKTDKQALLYTVIVFMILMSLGSCSGGIRDAYEQQSVLVDSLQRELIMERNTRPIIHLPMTITIITNDGYSVAIDSEGKQFMIDCNPEKFKLNQKIGE